MRSTSRSISLLLAMMFTATQLFACSNNRESDRPPPAVDDTVSSTGASTTPDYSAREAPVQERSSGMSPTTKKVIVLAGAAALYYLYKHHKNAAATSGVDSQYYLSKNGRVYYRDAEHRAHWVTPPPNGIPVPEKEAAAYQEFQGYNNQSTGRDLSGLATDERY
jgi:hypothetical protein